LNNSEKNSNVSRDLRDLFTAFFTLFGQSFKCGNTNANR
jgi:hypothetical protein